MRFGCWGLGLWAVGSGDSGSVGTFMSYHTVDFEGFDYADFGGQRGPNCTTQGL